MDKELVRSALFKTRSVWSSVGKAALRGMLPGAAIGATGGAIHGAATPGGSAFGGAFKGALGGAALGGAGMAAMRGARIATTPLARAAQSRGYTNMAGVLKSTGTNIGRAENAIGLGGNQAPAWAKGLSNWTTGTAAPAVQSGLQGAAKQVGKVATASSNSQYLAQKILDRAFRG